MRTVTRAMLVLLLLLDALVGHVDAAEEETVVVVEKAGEWHVLPERTRLHIGSRLRPGNEITVDGLEGRIVLYFENDSVQPFECRADVPCRPSKVPSRTGLVARASYMGRAILGRFAADPPRYVSGLTRGLHGAQAAMQVVSRDDLQVSLGRLLGSRDKATLRGLSRSADDAVTVDLGGGRRDVSPGVYDVFRSDSRDAEAEARILVVVPADLARASEAFRQCNDAIARLRRDIKPATASGLRAACLDEVSVDIAP